MKIIEVNNLSKSYRIGQKKESYFSLRDELVDLTKKPIQWLRKVKQVRPDFWALKDINFSVEKGEVVGVIGRNGAGKSTLLKILSRITPPTKGEAIIRGRVSSLLEVGTGFHKELTGRENVYLNGAILGMTKKEIDMKFDKIVEFAELEKFLDTPVKRYSSGMYVRLAFAVAAHLEPEILLVDEVLAVGDYEFQKKCLQKMDKVSHEGRTVLYVSHNMASVIKLCTRTILLDLGKIVMAGPTLNIVEKYIGMRKEDSSEVIWENPANAPGDDIARLHGVRILSMESKPISEADIDKDILVELSYWNLKEDVKLLASIHLVNSQGITVLTTLNMPSANVKPDPWYGRPSPKGLFRSVCRIPGNFLNEGVYFINAYVASLAGAITAHVAEEQVVSFDVIDTGVMRKEFSDTWLGVVRPRLDWSTEYKGPLEK